jgi:hypothetical protein
MLARWKLAEKAARVANGFERRPVVVTSDPFGPMVGVSMYPPGAGGPPSMNMTAVQEAYMLGARRRRA